MAESHSRALLDLTFVFPRARLAFCPSQSSPGTALLLLAASRGGRMPFMRKPTGIHRRLRFTLRSLLLGVLAVALYLGWERWQADAAQRQIAAIRELGGEVLELDSSPWSLLRLVDPATYGRRIRVAEMPSNRLQEAIPLIQSVSSLRQLHVTYDVEHEVEPNWEVLQRKLGAVTVIPVAVASLYT